MTKTAQHELDGCKHLKITDTGEDIFDHPAYQYGCLLKNKNRNLWRDFLNFPYFTGFPAP